MKCFQREQMPGNPFLLKNWESDVEKVCVEPCDRREDPLGYHAIYYADHGKNNYVIGASFLVKRERSLQSAGYDAPWTHKAIDMIENELGQHLLTTAQA